MARNSKDIIKELEKIDFLLPEDQIAPYQYIFRNSARYRKGGFEDAELFEFVYINFYKSLRGVPMARQPEFKEKLFRLIRNQESDIQKIMKILKKISKRDEFSFATKIAHTANPDENPIWDKYIWLSTGVRHINFDKNSYEDLKAIHRDIINAPAFPWLLKKWKARHKHSDGIPNSKCLDFMLWKLGIVKEIWNAMEKRDRALQTKR